MKSDFSGHEAELYQSIVDMHNATNASSAQKKSLAVETKLNELDFSNEATKTFFLKQTKLSEEEFEQYSPLEHLVFAALAYNPSNQAYMVNCSKPLLLLLEKLDFEARDLEHARKTLNFAGKHHSNTPLSRKTEVAEAVSVLLEKLAFGEANKRRMVATAEGGMSTIVQIEHNITTLKETIEESKASIIAHKTIIVNAEDGIKSLEEIIETSQAVLQKTQAELELFRSTAARTQELKSSSSAILHGKRRYDEVAKKTSTASLTDCTVEYEANKNLFEETATDEVDEDSLAATTTDKEKEKKSSSCTIS